MNLRSVTDHRLAYGLPSLAKSLEVSIGFLRAEIRRGRLRSTKLAGERSSSAGMWQPISAMRRSKKRPAQPINSLKENLLFTQRAERR